MPRLVHSTTTHPSPRPGRIATPGLEARRAAGWRASGCGRLAAREGARPEVTQSSALPSSRAARGPGVALRAFPRRGARAGLRRPLERGCAGRRDRHEAQVEERRGAREDLVHRHAPERTPAVRHRDHGRRPDDVRAVLGAGEVGEAGSHALAGVAVQLHERSRHTRRRRLGGQRELAHQALSIIEGGIRRTALAVAPGGRQLRGRHADLDAARVDHAVPLRDLDPPPRIAALTGAEVVAGLRGLIAGAVLAVRPRIARVALLRELVVARLRVRGVDHAEATVELVRLRAEVEDPGADQDRGQREARALAALVAERAVHVVARGVVAAPLDVRTLADRPALDAHGVLAGGGGVLGHGEGRDGRRRRLRHTPRVDPGRLRARARRPAAVGVAGADGEAVHARIGGADLHGRRIGRSEARRLVGPRDRLPRNDRRAQWEGRGGGGGGRRRRGGGRRRRRRRGRRGRGGRRRGRGRRRRRGGGGRRRRRGGRGGRVGGGRGGGGGGGGGGVRGGGRGRGGRRGRGRRRRGRGRGGASRNTRTVRGARIAAARLRPDARRAAVRWLAVVLAVLDLAHRVAVLIGAAAGHEARLAAGRPRGAAHHGVLALVPQRSVLYRHLRQVRHAAHVRAMITRARTVAL